LEIKCFFKKKKLIAAVSTDAKSSWKYEK
jgi:hypothetical protein